MATEAQRKHALAVMDFMRRHASQMDYPPHDVRTWRDSQCWSWSEQTLEHVLNGGGRYQGDCSQTCAFILKCAGLWHWSQPGATSSHLQLLPHYENAKYALVGGLVVFGGGGGHHEAIVHTPDPKGGNPLLFSHGRPGVNMVRLKDEAAAQARLGYPGVRLLSIAHL